MQALCSVDHATGKRRPRRAIRPGAWRRLSRAMAAVVLLLQALVVTAVPAAADGLPPAVTYTSAGSFPPCPAGTYSVPAGARYIEVVANGGAGSSGATDPINSDSTGGSGGSGAKVAAIFPASAGQTLTVVVGRAGNNDTSDAFSGWPDGGDNGFGNGQGGGSSFVTTQPLVASTGCKDIATSHLDRSKMLVLAGGGGGGGGGNTFGSGGNGGSAGANSDFSGQAGSTAYHLDTDCGQGGGGGGGSATGPGTYGSGGCAGASNGNAGSGFYGGAAPETSSFSIGQGGAGGGGWYGGGSGGGGTALGGGGGGAGSSYVSPTAHASGISQAAASDGTSVTITPLPTPTTTASTGTGVALTDWYTAAPTITLTASEAGGVGVATTYYAIDNAACSATNVIACQVYSSPFSVGTNGLHTLTWFSVDKLTLDEALQTRSFAVTLTSAGVSAASIGSGTNPSATAGGAAGTAGSISVSGTGSGVVGAAVYTADPAGAPVFNSSGTYVDVTIAGSGLSSITIKDCNLNGGNSVYWNTGTAWALVSNQSYDPSTQCVTMTVNSTTVPTLSQLGGTPIAAGSPPTTTPVATMDNGQPYTSGTWTNHSVTVAFNCTAHATATPPVTLASDGPDQTAKGTCTDGLGQTDTRTFTGIDIDKTPPTCSISVSPTVLWPPDSKSVAITGTVTIGDNLSGIASVVGGPVTSNEDLGHGDVQGFTVNTTYASPLKLRAILNLTGTLVAKRAGNGSGRSYSQVVAITDQAGNSASCSWTVTVTHDQATVITTAPGGRPAGVLPANTGGSTKPSSAPPSR